MVRASGIKKGRFERRFRVKRLIVSGKFVDSASDDSSKDGSCEPMSTPGIVAGNTTAFCMRTHVGSETAMMAWSACAGAMQVAPT